MDNLNENLKNKLEALPRRPGVYLMKDAHGKVIYVGKAVDLRQRVRSYFQPGSQANPKTRVMAGRISDLDFAVTDNEVEALILECNLIKEYRPRYNVSLKDDKQYPYVRVTVQEPFPRIHTTRRVQKDGARYFGPYTDAGAVRETVRLIRRLFPLRCCRGEILPEKTKRPCLNYHIKRCLAPCSGEVDREEYRKMVDEVLLFLEGKSDRLLALLQNRMMEAAEKMEYEKAARLRDQYRAVEALGGRQKIVSTGGGDRDVLAIAARAATGCVQAFVIRNGKMIGQEHFMLNNPAGEDEAGLMAAFVQQYYSRSDNVPPELLLSVELPEKELLEEWLSGRRGRRVRLVFPKRGEKKSLVDMALENARLFLEQELLREQQRDPGRALQELAEVLGLEAPPFRIEGYDVSHLQGEGTVSAMVVFQGGQPHTSDYRRFSLRSLEKPDDYAAIRETIKRRFARLVKAREENGDINPSDPFMVVPDLVLIDGGAGQLSSARQALAEQGYDHVPVIALAKEEELVFRVDRREPLRLPKTSAALQLLQRVRDEAHRFVITYQRKVRKRRGRSSKLLEVPGIGEARRKALLRHFGSIGAIAAASVDELASVKGMTRAVAERLHDALNREEEE